MTSNDIAAFERLTEKVELRAKQYQPKKVLPLSIPTPFIGLSFNQPKEGAWVKKEVKG